MNVWLFLVSLCDIFEVDVVERFQFNTLSSLPWIVNQLRVDNEVSTFTSKVIAFVLFCFGILSFSSIFLGLLLSPSLPSDVSIYTCLGNLLLSYE